MDAKLALVFNGGFGGQVGQMAEGLDEFGPAIRIAAVIEGIDADEDVEGIEGFGPAQSKSKENSVAGGYVGNGNLVLRWVEGIFGHTDIVGKGRMAYPAEIEGNGFVVGQGEEAGDVAGGIDFETVALAIIDGEAVAGIALRLGDGRRSVGVEPAAKQDDGIGI